MATATGIIIFYLPDKDYGYLRLLDTREEFYFRGKNLQPSLVPRAGDLVQFVLRQSQQGWYADAIQRAGLG